MFGIVTISVGPITAFIIVLAIAVAYIKGLIRLVRNMKEKRNSKHG